MHKLSRTKYTGSVVSPEAAHISRLRVASGVITLVLSCVMVLLIHSTMHTHILSLSLSHSHLPRSQLTVNLRLQQRSQPNQRRSQLPREEGEEGEGREGGGRVVRGRVEQVVAKMMSQILQNPPFQWVPHWNWNFPPGTFSTWCIVHVHIYWMFHMYTVSTCTCTKVRFKAKLTEYWKWKLVGVLLTDWYLSTSQRSWRRRPMRCCQLGYWQNSKTPNGRRDWKHVKKWKR